MDFSRLNIVMADIKYVDHVRIELETQVFGIRFMDYLSINDHLSYSQISNYIQQQYNILRSDQSDKNFEIFILSYL